MEKCWMNIYKSKYFIYILRVIFKKKLNDLDKIWIYCVIDVNMLVIVR